jgi:spermidine/putrescine transport system permease protein
MTDTLAGLPTRDTATPVPVRRKRRKASSYLLPAFFWLVMIWTVIPIVFMIIFSFNQAPQGRIAFNWFGLTDTWYRNVFAIGGLTQALEHSLAIAFLTAIISMCLGTPMALAMARYRFYGKTATDVMIFADIAAPSVVVGASLLGFFLTLNIPRGLTTILIAHVAFSVVFVVVVVRARLSGLDRSLDRAAADLGATPWVAFWKVIFPLIVPGIIAGGLLAFAMSIDDLIITSFVAGQSVTFPIWVYGAVKTGIPPQVFVMGTLIFAGGILIALVNTLANSRRQA